MNLPDLTGTQRQLDWAKDIRPRKLRQWETQMTEYLKNPRRTADQKEERVSLFERVQNVTDAGWWIDARDKYLDEVSPNWRGED